MQRTCLTCSEVIPPQVGRQQPRKYCVTCRPPRNRGEATVTTLRSAPPAQGTCPGSASGSPVAPTLHAATLQRLAEHGQATTPEGVLVLELARQIDAGGHSGASLASLSGAFSKALVIAMKDAGQNADVIDTIFGTG